jgi:hypothetical protein
MMDFVSWDDDYSHYDGKNNPFMFQSTSTQTWGHPRLKWSFEFERTSMNIVNGGLSIVMFAVRRIPPRQVAWNSMRPIGEEKLPPTLAKFENSHHAWSTCTNII